MKVLSHLALRTLERITKRVAEQDWGSGPKNLALALYYEDGALKASNGSVAVKVSDHERDILLSEGLTPGEHDALFVDLESTTAERCSKSTALQAAKNKHLEADIDDHSR